MRWMFSIYIVHYEEFYLQISTNRAPCINRDFLKGRSMRCNRQHLSRPLWYRLPADSYQQSAIKSNIYRDCTMSLMCSTCISLWGSLPADSYQQSAIKWNLSKGLYHEMNVQHAHRLLCGRLPADSYQQSTIKIIYQRDCIMRWCSACISSTMR